MKDELPCRREKLRLILQFWLCMNDCANEDARALGIDTVVPIGKWTRETIVYWRGAENSCNCPGRWAVSPATYPGNESRRMGWKLS